MAKKAKTDAPKAGAKSTKKKSVTKKVTEALAAGVKKLTKSKKQVIAETVGIIDEVAKVKATPKLEKAPERTGGHAPEPEY